MYSYKFSSKVSFNIFYMQGISSSVLVLIDRVILFILVLNHFASAAKNKERTKRKGKKKSTI